ncbi:MAG TPA: sigma-54 dependent transcriptional regulator [Candidatus Dormibacteraeota bacterium]|nr:sigma-54 dependent transcriptional regulator [Candidatus Dormibacteraeota bacterium]
MSDSLLLIEDEALLGTELARHFRREGWEVALAPDLASARRALHDDELAPLVVVSDMQLPDGNALDLLSEVRDRRAGAGEWIFLTGYGSVADSVRALRLGAYDFLEKPCDQKRLDLIVAGAARSARAQRQIAEAARQQHQSYPVEAFVGRSAAAAGVRDVLRKLSEVPFSALVIGGETGTGKGLATRILHYSGARTAGPLVEINCAALPRELLESELFGHEAGAFTGAKKRRRGLIEQASGGTLFLDEIGELELDLQAKLLKVIEDQRLRPLGGEQEVRVDVQLVAASNRDLATQAREGTFREDLYHRLSVFGLRLPPLRERLEDIEDLVPLIVAEYNAKARRNVRSVPDAVWTALKAHSWPGNVRELRNVIERCVLFADGDQFPLQWLQLPGHSAPAVASAGAAPPPVEDDRLVLPLDGSMSIDDMDRHIVATAVARADGNLSAAARMLGTTRQTLRYRVKKYGIKAGED